MGEVIGNVENRKLMAGLHIEAYSDGGLQIQTTTQDRVIIFGLLEMAKHMLAHQKQGEQPKIIIPDLVPPKL